MARFSSTPRATDRPVFALLRAAAALAGIAFVLVALSYSGYLSYTELDAPEVDPPTYAFEVDPTGRRLSYGRSWIDRDGRLWRMHLEGSPVEIGDARGRLSERLFRELDDRVRDMIERRYGAWLEQWTAAMVLRWDYRGADRYLDEEHRNELAAMAKALPANEDDRIDSYHRMFLYQCVYGLGQRLDDVLLEGSMFAATPKRTAAGEPGNLIIGRTLSFDLGRDFEADRIVAFHHPDGRYPFVSVGWAGLMGVVTGINARGIFVALDPARTDDPPEEGAPLPLVLRTVLEEADTLERAVEIIQEAELRSSGIVLVGDGMHRKAVVMEVAPRDRENRRIVRGEDEAVVWATDHMVDEAFESDLQNDWVRRYTSSGYRYDRLEELLTTGEPMDPARAVAVLRDRRGKGDEELGLGNHNALENLTTTHSVVVDATAMVMWVSEGPSTLGRYQAIDLARSLGRDDGPAAPLDDLPADPLLYSEEFRDYQEAIEAIDHARVMLGRGMPERARWSAQVALALAPDLGELHRLLGDIERELGNFDRAREHYKRYLELVPGRRREQVRVEGILAELEG
ncbi:MAG: tetratricopeptide repeat protein [Myxococcales bacterium]|nr:tetratricopeptide repeat protein [Myxococcales bacterium]MCB9713605.1 tetratricopeptide repeat protein [Myxococcales bacterium]